MVSTLRIVWERKVPIFPLGLKRRRSALLI